MLEFQSLFNIFFLVPQQEEYQMEQNNYNHSEMDFRENSKE